MLRQNWLKHRPIWDRVVAVVKQRILGSKTTFLKSAVASVFARA
jgi:L-rhamnose mutarotase